MELIATKTLTVDSKLAVPGAPMVYLRSDPRKEPGVVERVTGTDDVTVFWPSTGRRWIYAAKALKAVRA